MSLNEALDYIDEREEDMFVLLEKLVNINTYTHNKKNANIAADLICDSLKELNIDFERRELQDYGDQIIATIKGSKPGKILLLGHYDTVHPPNTGRTIYETDKRYAYGPGVADMKAGIVGMIYNAAAIKSSAMETCDIDLLFTPDEEYGSPVSRTIIREKAKDATAAFVLESGRPNGEVVTKRKGSAHFNFFINGKAAHSGVAKEKGISAIEELGFKIVEIQKLNDSAKGISVNIGTVSGGTNSNVVAAEVSGTIHVGYPTLTDFKSIKQKLSVIFSKSYLNGTTSFLTDGSGIPPMEKHPGVIKLYEIVKTAGEKLDLTLEEKHEKGASDAGFLASLGVPTICGMGPIGGKLHSEEEYMVKDSLLTRFKLLLLSISTVTNRIAEFEDVPSIN